MKKKIFIFVTIISFTSMLLSCGDNLNKPTNNINNKEDIEITDNLDINSANKNDSSNNTNSNNIDKNTSNNINPEKNTRTINSRLYFFDTSKLELVYINEDIQVEDNAIIKALTKALQSNNDSNLLSLTNKVSIKSASVDPETNVLKIIFSDDYTNYMTLGTATESGLLYSLLCTYGYNLNVNKIAIYFNNNLYTSLKGELPDGYFTVNYKKAKPYIQDSNQENTNNIKNKNCRIFYYTSVDNSFYYKDIPIAIENNALVTALTKELKNPPNSDFISIPSNTYVKSAKLEKDKSLLTIDLSKDYYEILPKVGSSSESGVLNSLAYTYCYNYGVNNVEILIDGKPYSGSHLAFEDGYFIIANYDNTKPLK